MQEEDVDQDAEAVKVVDWDTAAADAAYKAKASIHAFHAHTLTGTVLCHDKIHTIVGRDCQK